MHAVSEVKCNNVYGKNIQEKNLLASVLNKTTNKKKKENNICA